MKDLYSTHVSYSDLSCFKSKNRDRWPEIRDFIYDQNPEYPNIYNKESLINSRYIPPSYKKKVEILKDGEACFTGSNGGGRNQFVRKLTEEEIIELEFLEDKQNTLNQLRNKLKKLEPDLLSEISKVEKELKKQKEKMRKSKIWS